MSSSPRTPRVIILDEHEADRDLVARLLGASGYEVVATGDAGEVVQSARVRVPQTVLVDLRLKVLQDLPRWARRRDDPELELASPFEDGYAVLVPLEHDSSVARFPLVVIHDPATGHGSDLRFGVVDYLAKPVDGQALRQSVAAAAPAQAELPESEVTPVSAFDVLPRPLRTALIVDGDARFRRWIRSVMGLHSFRIQEADDAAQGISGALASRPWLILSEVELPGPMDGLKMCREMRQRSLTSHTPFLFLSGRDEYEERYRGLNAGADDFVSKRSPLREILIRIQLVLKRYADLGARSGHGAGLEGRLDLVGAVGILQMCHLGKLSGVLTVRADGHTAEIQFLAGEIVFARTSNGHDAEAVYEFIAWDLGRFTFVPGEPLAQKPLGEGFDHLLLEGCRRLDEARRDGMPPLSVR
jgi:DNA-binding response OmpR family regulator